MNGEEIERRHQEMRAYLNEPDSRMGMAKTLRYAAEVLAERIMPALQLRHRLHQQRQWAEYDESDKAKDHAASKDEDLTRVSEMLFQMSYENAFKALLLLQGKLSKKLGSTHNLEKLQQASGIQVDELERQYLAMLSRMNQLGRYQVTSDDKYGMLWHGELKDRRTILDQKLSEAWLAGGGSLRNSSISS